MVGPSNPSPFTPLFDAHDCDLTEQKPLGSAWIIFGTQPEISHQLKALLLFTTTALPLM